MKTETENLKIGKLYLQISVFRLVSLLVFVVPAVEIDVKNDDGSRR